MQNPKTEIYFRLLRSAINAITDIINSGHYITYTALVNNEKFDPELINIGINLKMSQFLITIAEDFRRTNQETINLFGIQKAVILSTVNYKPLQPAKFPLTPSIIANIEPDDLIRAVMDLCPKETFTIPYLCNVARNISNNELNLN